MTQMGLNWLNYKETERANKASEAIKTFAENERKRSNLATETLRLAELNETKTRNLRDAANKSIQNFVDVANNVGLGKESTAYALAVLNDILSGSSGFEKSLESVSTLFKDAADRTADADYASKLAQWEATGGKVYDPEATKKYFLDVSKRTKVPDGVQVALTRRLNTDPGYFNNESNIPEKYRQYVYQDMPKPTESGSTVDSRLAAAFTDAAIEAGNVSASRRASGIVSDWTNAGGSLVGSIVKALLS